MRLIRRFGDLRLKDVPVVGGKNASLGELLAELTPLGVRVPDGFATTAEAYRELLRRSELERTIGDILRGVRSNDVDDLVRRSAQIRELVVRAPFPRDFEEELRAAYSDLSRAYGVEATDVAVRSSATAEDLPNASFAGQQESFLNVRGAASVSDAVRKAFASLFTPCAISYRIDMGFDHMQVALSVGVQKMVRSDLASAGVIFTLDPDTGHRGVVLVTSSFGLGESVVQGRVVPDSFYIHKANLEKFRPLVWRKLGTKEVRLVYDDTGHRQVRSEPVPPADRERFSLSDDDALELARWSLLIEKHYTRLRGEPTPMGLEWAKDGVSGELFIVQARPETVHSRRAAPTQRLYELAGHGEPLVTGLAIGDSVASARARVIRDPRQIAELLPGEILITEITDPDWEPIMKKAAGIVTERGGICGQAPSDYPDFAAFLVEHGIDSVSLSPDALVRTTQRILEVEAQRAAVPGTPNIKARRATTDAVGNETTEVVR
jgi:pyruvate,water dikinase